MIDAQHFEDTYQIKRFEPKIFLFSYPLPMLITKNCDRNSDNVCLLCFGSASLHGSTYLCPICKRFPISTLEPCQAGKLFQHLAKLFSGSFQNPPFSESSQIDMNSCPTHRKRYYFFIHASSPTWGVLTNSETWQHLYWSALLSSDLKSICRTHMCLRKVWQRHFVISYLDQQPPPDERGGFTLSLRSSIWKTYKHTNTQINTNIDRQIQIQYKYKMQKRAYWSTFTSRQDEWRAVLLFHLVQGFETNTNVHDN